ncbi:MAG: nucleoside kinase [Actinobacteria bacterium]|nr:nucleoside kinase [Actinomycetota bacterium]
MRETHLREGRQTVKLGLVKVVHDLFPDENLQTSYSILEGIFCGLDNSVLSVREVRRIEQSLRAWVSAGEPIEFLGKGNGYYRYRVGGVEANAVYPALLDPTEVEPFTIVPFSSGFIVDFGDVGRGSDRPLIPPVLLASEFEKTRNWLDHLDIEQVTDVNRRIAAGRARRLIDVAEALHEKEISDIADRILAQRRSLRVLLVSGPSSSGKTTFTERISTQLRVRGIRPVSLSLDDYFVNRADTPRDEDGRYDFDSLEALDLPLLHDHLHRLVDGETVDVPRFDFVSGTRLPDPVPLRVREAEVLVIEGLHALDPNLLNHIPAGLTFKIYVSALGGLNIDLINRVPTTEIRLLRRLVRDDRTRGIDPEETLAQWDSVRRGEYEYVFRFQEDADVMFNTSLFYELNALRCFAEPVLARIPDSSAHRATRDRLANLLSFFEPIDTSTVPFNSILREFIGGSAYED